MDVFATGNRSYVVTLEGKPLRRISGDVLSFPSQETAEQYRKGLPSRELYKTQRFSENES